MPREGYDPDGTYLIEYFDADTNELRLYLRHDGKDLQIEHPYGKVKNFKDAVLENQLKFNLATTKVCWLMAKFFYNTKVTMIPPE